MSDFPCDPLFEICETDSAEQAEVDVEEAYTELYEPDYEIETYNVIWGGASAAMLGVSAYFYKQYNYDIWNNNKYPYRYEGIYDYDKDWALSTKEVSAWAKVVSALNWMHGLGLGMWAANMLLDNKGGVIHYLYFRTVQFYYLAPLVSSWFALHVMGSYVQSIYEEDADKAYESITDGEHSVEYFFRRFNEDDRWVNYEPNLVDTTQYTNMFVLWSAVTFFSLVQSASYDHIATQYEEAFNAAEADPSLGPAYLVSDDQ